MENSAQESSLLLLNDNAIHDRRERQRQRQRNQRENMTEEQCCCYKHKRSWCNSIPFGKPKEQRGPKDSLQYKEYKVYNVDHIRMRYVIQVKFNFKR
ncbi:hypothetical protein IFM89_007832 [Coptis chinensis]|uniref:Poly [ADP-ribose] polymerase n=1 Tax=Coptis chinensis TaxID=261450 RepID=A0A835HWF6_9MAGN|nr:hypothetical protein IFM89_007832 [Coptis chinensis]